MDSFLANIGVFAICFLIICVYKKIMEYHELKWSRFYEDEKIYKAAEKFVNGASSDNIKVIFANSIYFDEKDAEEILSRSIPHRTDKDGGYREFIKSVNKVLGTNIYSERCHTH